MNLDFAVERLYQVGWTPGDDAELERLPDGRRVPTVSCVKREFGRAGLQLSIQHAPKFQCYRASWSPADKQQDDAGGTVVAKCEREAALYALAQLHATRADQPIGVA